MLDDTDFRILWDVGSPRVALREMGIPVKAIDYVEIDEKAVRSYNAMQCLKKSCCHCKLAEIMKGI